MIKNTKEFKIDWANKPTWAEVWIEDASKECGGWHKSGKRYQDECWEDNNGSFYYKHEECSDNFVVHYPPATEKTLVNNNDWFTKGELPPVGTICKIKLDCISSEAGSVVEILAHHQAKASMVAVYKNLDVISHYHAFVQRAFEPLNEKDNWCIDVASHLNTTIPKRDLALIYDLLKSHPELAVS